MIVIKRLKRFFWLWLITLTCVNAMAETAQATTPTSSNKTSDTVDITPSFLIDVIRHTIWPNEDKTPYFTISILDDGQHQGFIDTLNQKGINKRVRSKLVHAVLVQRANEAKNSHLLYIPSQFNHDLSKIYNTLLGSNTLLVTRDAKDKQHIMMNWNPPIDEDIPHYLEIHKHNLYIAGLIPKNSLFLLGGTDLSVVTLDNQASLSAEQYKKNVSSMANTVTNQQTLIQKQNKQLILQTKDIQQKEKEIKNLSNILIHQQKEIDNREKELKRIENLLLSQKKDLDIGKLDLKTQENNLEEKKGQVKKYSGLIRENERIILQQSLKLQEQSSFSNQQADTITEQKKVLKDQEKELEKQQQRLLWITLILIAISALTIITFYFYSMIRKSKQALEKQHVELEQTAHDLEEASNTKSRFLSTMSHEIRTPLNGVIGMVELLRDTNISSKQKRYLDIIHSSGELLLNVINDILDYSKIEAGKMDIESLSVSLENLMQDSASIFAVKSASEEFDLIIKTSPNLPSRIIADPTRLKQVMVNLLSNAFKFTNNGYVLLSADIQQRKLILSVTDTGEGMTPDQCELIFESFKQADSSINRKHGGTGLGLSICKRIAEIMGGNIDVISEQGKGSTFWVELPLQEADESLTNALRFTNLKGKRYLAYDLPEIFMDNLVEHAKFNDLEITSIKQEEQLESLDSKDFVHGLICSGKTLSTASDKLMETIRRLKLNSLIYISEVNKVSFSAKDFHCHQLIHIDSPVSAYSLLSLIENHAASQHPITTEKIKDKRLNYSRLNVLVAEDNRVNQMVIQGILRKFGITPTISNDGGEAIQEVKKCIENPAEHHPFDLILMDCEMPGVDGYRATQEIRSLEEIDGNHTQIVALTAHVLPEFRERSLASGMDDLLCKPVKTEEIESLLFSVNQQSSSKPSPPKQSDNGPSQTLH